MTLGFSEDDIAAAASIAWARELFAALAFDDAHRAVFAPARIRVALPTR
ncbi:MAG: hypothetical protein R3C16_08740 [Hyphomonadaceae bacterium]